MVSVHLLISKDPSFMVHDSRKLFIQLCILSLQVCVFTVEARTSEWSQDPVAELAGVAVGIILGVLDRSILSALGGPTVHRR